jgi:hypothetical protein
VNKTFIYKGAAMIGVGRNLSILMQHARKRGGVTRINITNLAHQAKVEVIFADGAHGESRFEDQGIAVKWACKLSDDRRSWWSHCVVVHYDGTVGGKQLRGEKKQLESATA